MDDPVALYTFILTIFTGLLAWVSYKQVVLTRAEFIATHRPKIRIRRIASVGPQPDAKATATIDAANIGDTDATIVEIGVDIFPRHPKIANSGQFNAMPRPVSPMTIPPGKQLSIEVSGASALKNIDVAGIEATLRDLCLLGIIQYRDDRGTVRNTSFFRIYDQGAKRFRFAPDHDEYADWEYED